MLRYKIDVLSALKDAGYSSYRIRKEKILPDAVVQYFRDGRMVGAGTIDILCRLLECQPGDIVEYIPGGSE